MRFKNISLIAFIAGLTLCFGTLLGGKCFASEVQLAQKKPVINELLVTLATVQRTFISEATNAQLQTLALREIRDSAASSRQELPAEYLEPFALVDQQIRSAIHSTNTPLIRSALTDLASETAPRLKLLHEGKAIGLSTVPIEVAVRVATYKNNIQVGGFEIRANPRGYGHTGGGKYLFGKSDAERPSELKLVIGNKLFWALSSTGEVIGETTQFVGDASPTIVRIDIRK
jgi:hypothetical protein